MRALNVTTGLAAVGDRGHHMRRATRVVAAASAAAVGIGLGIAGAPSASAATASIDCDASSSPVVFAVNPGQIVSLTFSNCTNFEMNFSALAHSITVTQFGTPTDLCSETVPLPCTDGVGGGGIDSTTIVAPNSGLSHPVALAYNARFIVAIELVVRSDVGATDAVATDAVADAPPIPAWVQAYGRASKDATCLDGWNPSWQSWAEPVTGGWVCTRSSPSLG